MRVLLLILSSILSLTCIPTHAQQVPQTRAGCIDYCHGLKNDYLDDALAAAGINAWCFYWFVECACIEAICGSFDIKCQLNGGSPYGLGSSPYSLGSGPYGIGFDPFSGDSCTVRESEFGAIVLTPPSHTITIFFRSGR